MEIIREISQQLASTDAFSIISVILALIVMEGLLSVDNALVIAAMASHLPGRQKKLALTAGLIGAYIGRAIMLIGAAWLYKNQWIKIAGAVYLIYLAISHLSRGSKAAKDNESTLKTQHGFWATVVFVELADLVFSIDNVMVAVALSPKIWVVILGVFIGILTMRLVAGILVSLIERHPILSHLAYIIVGYVGLQLLIEMGFHIEIREWQKFIVICTILAVGLAWERWQWMKNILRIPLFAALKSVQFLDKIIHVILYPISYSINAIHGLKKE